MRTKRECRRYFTVYAVYAKACASERIVTTSNRRLLIEADLTAVERPQRVNRGLQTFVCLGHNFPTWLLYGVYFLVIVVLLIAPKMKK